MAKKKVKKFQAGGDARRMMSVPPGLGSSTASIQDPGFPRRPVFPRPPGGSGSGGATGAVGDVLTAGRAAQDFLGEAGQALGTPQGNVGILGRPPLPMKKGGKVAKKKASGKVRGVGKARKGIRPVKMVKMKG